MDEKMEHEEDKWLEQQLKATPDIDQDGFSARIMDEVKVYQSNQARTRKSILLTTYVVSFVLFMLITPWSWLIAKINAVQLDISGLLSLNSDSQIPLIGIAVLFVILFTVYIFGQETN